MTSQAMAHQLTAGLYRLLVQLQDTVVSRQNSQERKCCHFLRRYQTKPKNPKILESWRRRGLKSAKSLFFLFFGTLQENASFWWKRLPFHEEVPKKTKKTKILESWRRRGLKSPKSLVFWFFWHPSRKMQAFCGKRCHFVRRYQKQPKNQRF